MDIKEEGPGTEVHVYHNKTVENYQPTPGIAHLLSCQTIVMFWANLESYFGNSQGEYACRKITFFDICVKVLIFCTTVVL